eukprot:4856391-Amphidinium_carterae.1
MPTLTGLIVASPTPADSLPLATFERSRALLNATHRFLEVNEHDPDSLLGQGAFGRTYRGRLYSVDGRRIDKVAVKFPKPSKIAASGADHERFKEEAIRLAS